MALATLAVLSRSAMPATAASRKPPAEIDKTAARRFPLVHKLIHFADLRHFYRDMREALITANRTSRLI